MDFELTHSGIYLPRGKQETPFEQVVAAYRVAHTYCPQCGSARLTTTTMGHLPSSRGEYRDTNRATCECGWRGTVHQLISLPQRDYLFNALPGDTLVQTIHGFKAAGELVPGDSVLCLTAQPQQLRGPHVPLQPLLVRDVWHRGQWLVYAYELRRVRRRHRDSTIFWSAPRQQYLARQPLVTGGCPRKLRPGPVGHVVSTPYMQACIGHVFHRRDAFLCDYRGALYRRACNAPDPSLKSTNRVRYVSGFSIVFDVPAFVACATGALARAALSEHVVKDTD